MSVPPFPSSPAFALKPRCGRRPGSTYVVARLSEASVRSDLLDPLPLHVAIAASDCSARRLFGAVRRLGRTVNLKTMTDKEWCRAGGAGFVGAAAGTYAFFEKLRATYPYSGAVTEGPQAVFGRICLEFYRDDPAYDPLRDLVGGFIRSRFSVGPGVKAPCLLGQLSLGLALQTRSRRDQRSRPYPAIKSGQPPLTLARLTSSPPMWAATFATAGFRYGLSRSLLRAKKRLALHHHDHGVAGNEKGLVVHPASVPRMRAG